MATIKTSKSRGRISAPKKTAKVKTKVVFRDRGGEGNLQEKSVTTNGVVIPDSGYTGLSKVTVNVSSGGSNKLKLYAWNCDDITVYTTQPVTEAPNYSEHIGVYKLNAAGELVLADLCSPETWEWNVFNYSNNTIYFGDESNATRDESKDIEIDASKQMAYADYIKIDESIIWQVPKSDEYIFYKGRVCKCDGESTIYDLFQAKYNIEIPNDFDGGNPKFVYFKKTYIIESQIQ